MRDKRTGDAELRFAPRRLILAVALLAAFAVSPAAAHAVEYEYSHSFDGSDAVSGGAPLPAFNSNSLQHIGVDHGTSTVYVAYSPSGGRIYKFDSSGASQPFSSITPDTVITGQSFGSFGDLEVDNSGTATQGNFYAFSEGSQINGRSPSGALLGGNFPIAGISQCGSAVAPDGDIWINNFGQSRFVEYSSAGVATGEVLIPNVSSLCEIEIDSQGNFYFPSPYSDGPIYKFNSAGVSQGVFESSAGSTPRIGIDHSNDDVFVARGGTLLHYEPDGTLVETIGEATAEYPGLQSVRGIDVDPSTHYLYVANNRSGETKVDVFTPNDGPEVTTGSALSVERTTATLSGTVALAGNGDVTDCYFKYGTDTSYSDGTAPCVPAATPGTPFTTDTNVIADISGLSASTTYHFRLFATNANRTGSGSDETFTTDEAILLSTEPATEVETETATLNGVIDPEGFDVTYYFQYGPTTNYGRVTSTHPGVPLGTTTPGNLPVSVPVEDLTPGLQYHYRLVATNSTGTSYGADHTFKTFQPPSIESFTSSKVTADSAEIQARINPNGYETTYHVEYGTTPEYGSVAPIPGAVLGASEEAHPVAVALSGLQGVTYHFRVVAESQWGTTSTGDQTFSFYPPECPNATVRQQTGSQYLPDCRAYELVSPGFAGNVVLRNLPFYPSPYATSPPRFIFGGALGCVAGGGNCQAANIADKYVATRTNTGWFTRYVGLRGNEAVSNNGLYHGLALDRIIDFRQPGPSAPYLWSYNGDPMGRLPTDLAAIPGGDEAEAAWQPSPDFNHLAISSSQVAFDDAEEGLTSAPGSAYDYNMASGATTIISKTPAGADIPQEPTNTNTSEFILFPGSPAPFGPEFPSNLNPSVSVDGSHILMSTAKTSSGSSPVHLYMRVDGAITYDVSGGDTVDYVGMTKDGSRVLFTSDEQLTADDTDTGVDLFRWSEDGDEIIRLSNGGSGAGNGDSCGATWTAKCNVEVVERSMVSDYPIATDSGDVLFYSPELLAGPENGIQGGQNLYLYRDGAIQFIAQLGFTGNGALSRVQISPDGDHAAFITSSQLTSFDTAGFNQMYSYDSIGDVVRCVSCNPSGEPPTEDVEGSTNGFFMSNDGRTFWSTPDALVPKDTNELIDVYEFVEERPQLITSGTADIDAGTNNAGKRAAPAGFAGVTADGINAYFSSYDTLVAQDLNGPYMKFYNARTNGGFAPPQVDHPCVAADECHGDTSALPAPPVIASSGDLGSNGNVARKGKRRARRTARKRRKAQRRRAQRRRARRTARRNQRVRRHRSAVGHRAGRSRGRS